MKPKKYDEFKCDFEKGKPINLVPTKRGSVSIHDHEADLNNENANRTKLYYKLSKEQIELDAQETEDRKTRDAEKKQEAKDLAEKEAFDIEVEKERVEKEKEAAKETARLLRENEALKLEAKKLVKENKNK